MRKAAVVAWLAGAKGVKVFLLSLRGLESSNLYDGNSDGFLAPLPDKVKSFFYSIL